ncbi:MAG: heme ABC exporter ATP-binding protein CcmA [Phycisphaerae bacterium]|nr:heme ABC exporter ATP-binding protein CcmA [Phycisphaerae bacterium]
MAENAIIAVNEVSKAFTRPVLKKVSLSVDTPQSLFVCGINGAGKSTFLKLLAGLLQPDSGSVFIKGKCLRKETEYVKSKLGIIMHQSMVYPDLTVLENLDFFARLYGVPGRQERIRLLLEQVGLTAFRYDKASVLSRGLLQRLSIARAMVHEPEVMFADEPFTGLDMTSTDYLTAMLSDFRSRGGTVIMTTHDVSQGLRCADRVVVIDQGGIILDRGISQIDPSRFANDYVQYARESA